VCECVWGGWVFCVYVVCVCVCVCGMIEVLYDDVHICV